MSEMFFYFEFDLYIEIPYTFQGQVRKRLLTCFKQYSTVVGTYAEFFGRDGVHQKYGFRFEISGQNFSKGYFFEGLNRHN